ncbi:MAG: ATP-dependent helicase HrpB [Cumulibacter sp.]
MLLRPHLTRGLPFAAATDDLAAAVREHRVAVVEAPPGTGKTTLAPPILADIVSGRVVVTQPRRVAVRAAARRLATFTDTSVGEQIGFTVRGERAIGPQTRIEMVTPGVLLRRLLADPELSGVGAVILDEVHERGLDTDLLVGFLQEVRQLREDLVLVLMSATADAAGLAQLIGEGERAPVIGVDAETHPLTERWAPLAAQPLDARGVRSEFLEHVAQTTRRALREAPEGDALVFLPGVREVRQVAEALTGSVQAEVLQLHGQVKAREQDRAVGERRALAQRRVVVSTALAESSLTVDGVRIVVDAGLSREPRRDAVRAMSGLVTVRCARSSADQRAGRAARQRPGVVWRCYDEATYATLRPQVTPEVASADLTSALLSLARWGSPRGTGLALPTPLPSGAVADGEAVLRSLEAVDAEGRITERGDRLAGLPLSPRWGRALLDGAPLVGSRRAAEVVACAELDLVRAEADLLKTIAALRRGGPEAQRWEREVSRLQRLVRTEPDNDTGAGIVIALAYPERIARRVGGTYLFASGTRAAAPAELARHEWLAVADVARVAGARGEGTGASIRAAAPIDRDTALVVGEFTEEVRGSLAGGRLLARRVQAIGAIELSATPIPAAALGVVAVENVVRHEGLDVIGWSEHADALRRRLAMLHRHLGEPWPDVSDEALLDGLDAWLTADLASAADTGRLTSIDLLEPLRRLLPWPEASSLEELVPQRLQVPSGSRVRLDYPPVGADGPAVCAVRLQEVFGLTESPSILDGRVRLQFHLLSPARRPVAITDDLASFWAGPYAQVRAEMRGRYPKHAWPEDPLSAPAVRRGR